MKVGESVRHLNIKLLAAIVLVCILSACTIDVAIHSERTALERQIIGTHEEIDTNLLMLSSVRAVDKDGNTKVHQISDLKKRAHDARQNQRFNQDDLDELKSHGLIGETLAGDVALLPQSIRADTSLSMLEFAKTLLIEENNDRQIIWQRIIQVNEQINPSDLDVVRKTYAKQMIDKSPPGSWIQDSLGQWSRKP